MWVWNSYTASVLINIIHFDLLEMSWEEFQRFTFGRWERTKVQWYTSFLQRYLSSSDHLSDHSWNKLLKIKWITLYSIQYHREDRFTLSTTMDWSLWWYCTTFGHSSGRQAEESASCSNSDTLGDLHCAYAWNYIIAELNFTLSLATASYNSRNKIFVSASQVLWTGWTSLFTSVESNAFYCFSASSGETHSLGKPLHLSKSVSQSLCALLFLLYFLFSKYRELQSPAARATHRWGELQERFIGEVQKSTFHSIFHNCIRTENQCSAKKLPTMLSSKVLQHKFLCPQEPKMFLRQVLRNHF